MKGIPSYMETNENKNISYIIKLTYLFIEFTYLLGWQQTQQTVIAAYARASNVYIVLLFCHYAAIKCLLCCY